MSRQIKIELDPNGIVQNEGIHDAAIIEAIMTGEGDNTTAAVRCRSEDGRHFTFRFEGVRLFSLSFFGSQNIILDCQIINKSDAKDLLSKIKDLEKYAFEKYDILNDLIKKGDVTVVRFTPPNGAEINCICKVVKMESLMS